MITRVKFVSIPTRNQDASLAFYTEKLGFKVVTDQPFNETQRWIELKIPGAETRVVLFTPDGQADRIGTFWSGGFACDNVQQTYEVMKAAGVEIVQPPTAQPWGMFIIFKDIDGNQFVMSSNR